MMVCMIMGMPRQLKWQPGIDTYKDSDKANREKFNKYAFHGSGAKALDTSVSWSNG